MFQGIDVQCAMFNRLVMATKDTLREQGGYIRPIAHVFWTDGRCSEIDVQNTDDLTEDMIAHFLRDLDSFCVKHNVHVVFVCFPLPQARTYACMLTGLEWRGKGLIKSIGFMSNGEFFEGKHDIEQFDYLLENIRFESMFYELKGGFE